MAKNLIKDTVNTIADRATTNIRGVGNIIGAQIAKHQVKAGNNRYADKMIGPEYPFGMKNQVTQKKVLRDLAKQGKYKEMHDYMNDQWDKAGYKKHEGGVYERK
jgi:hypothetical protein